MTDILNGQARAELVRTLHDLERDIEHARAHGNALAQRLEDITRAHHPDLMPTVAHNRLRSTAVLAWLAADARLIRGRIEDGR